MAEEHIEQATGRKPVGFRAPGYSLSQTTVTELIRRGYLYDASVLPTFIGPLARAYFFKVSTLTQEELKQRKTMFGGFRDGFRRIRPYQWSVDGKNLVEIPVTTMPYVKIPIHMSYVLYLSIRSEALAERYFLTSLFLCRASGIAPSILLHPLDFLGREEADGVEFFPGMSLPRETKVRFVDRLLQQFEQMFRVVTLREHAIRAAQEADLPVMKMTV